MKKYKTKITVGDLIPNHRRNKGSSGLLKILKVGAFSLITLAGAYTVGKTYKELNSYLNLEKKIAVEFPRNEISTERYRLHPIQISGYYTQNNTTKKGGQY